MTFQDEILRQHTAILGKTGAGKSSTAKLLIEQVVAGGARVCILDPIKSDWWGLTSSADGRHAGLPFHILGGPRGHVPLHSAAGKAIADVVASGALPLSILDMADFEPGGQARFFVDFAPTLLRKMRGVVYLVIEEAHLFAPKERSGIGSENLAIHWAKTLATAGRSKGVRLVLVTQRTQALHNALLGSCDTLIAHRLTAPADQEPVVKWLKANTTKEILQRVSSSLSSLKTGEGWVCSGEAKCFELVPFPRIATYDNTATPTGDGDTRVVKTAAVDPEKLRAIIGDAVDQAKADDPKELRKALAEKDKRIKELERGTSISSASNERAKQEVKVVEKPVITDAQLARAEALVSRLEQVIERSGDLVTKPLGDVRGQLQELVGAVKAVRQPALPLPVAQTRASYAPNRPIQSSKPAPHARDGRQEVGGRRQEVGKAEQRILDSLAWWRSAGVEQPTRHQVAFVASYTVNGHFNNTLGALNTAGFITYPGPGLVALTPEGAVRSFTPGEAATRAALIAKVREVLRAEPQRRLFDVVVAAGRAVTREELATAANYTVNGHFNNTLGSLSSLGIVAYPSRGAVGLSAMFDALEA